MSGNTFNISSKDIIVTYKNALITVPILINGSGTDNIISFDSAETGSLDFTADGNYAAAVKNAVATGKLTLTGTSPSLTQLLNVMQEQFTLGGAIIGTITITNPSNLSEYRIDTVMLTSAPPVPTFGVTIKDFDINFKCAPFANISTLAAVINTARNVGSLL